MVRALDEDDVRLLEARRSGPTVRRPGDVRSEYQRDRARLLHSAAFRRLQGKTQVMGVGEGDFHRTRLTHSIECAQIGGGLIDILQSKISDNAVSSWIPTRDLIEASCFAHDLGHPPFGHKGEQALHGALGADRGFEGNGQTLRILTKLEKNRLQGFGIDPTRRLCLAVLKYPVNFSDYGENERSGLKPPKCYHDEEIDVVDWASEIFPDADRTQYRSLHGQEKPPFHTFDCSIMELADDIAYGVHDLEDLIARKLATKRAVESQLLRAFQAVEGNVVFNGIEYSPGIILERLFDGSYERKSVIAELVNLFVTSVEVRERDRFSHPLLSLNAFLPEELASVLNGMKKMTFELVISQAPVQQLERRGMMIVRDVYGALAEAPLELIPKSTWADGEPTSSPERRVCDFVAGMTDQYAERMYKRLFIPGWGSSGDEL